MSKVRRKVLLDLFASPSTLLPMVGGVTALIGSWAFGGEPWLLFGGIASLLGGVGLFTPRLIFGIEDMTQDAHEFVQQELSLEREKYLADLDQRLSQDGDPRNEGALRQLRVLYEQFHALARQRGRTSASAIDVLDKVNEMFQVCVDQLEQTLQLSAAAHGVEGQVRQAILRQREDIVGEVQVTVDHIAAAIQRFQGMAVAQKSQDLARLRDELNQTLQAARAAEKRLSEWEADTAPLPQSEEP